MVEGLQFHIKKRIGWTISLQQIRKALKDADYRLSYIIKPNINHLRRIEDWKPKAPICNKICQEVWWIKNID